MIKPIRLISLITIICFSILFSFGFAEKTPEAKTNLKDNASSDSENQSEDLTFTVGDVSFTMINVKGGTFQMGSNKSDANSDERPVHNVTLDSFYIGETEVTQALWKAVMGSEPSGDGGWNNLYGKGDNYPAYQINWNECQKFIKNLNKLTGKKFRLPTEAEWEYAARGGEQLKDYKHAGSNVIDDVAWYDENSESHAHPVKSKLPNELGLYDMSGNVWEWCEDRYGGKYYVESPLINPTGMSKGSERVLRGGGWYTSPRFCRVSYRDFLVPKTRSGDCGMRLVLDLTDKNSEYNIKSASNVAGIEHNGKMTFSVKGVSFNMIKVEGGTFLMGNDKIWAGYLGYEHYVTLKSSYYIGETEVTQALWKAVMGNNPSNWKGDNLPVENVSWDDCKLFISKLNQLTGKKFRLPTEAEWEFAARGGNKSKGYNFSGSNNIDDVAWYDEEEGWHYDKSKTHAVMTKYPNELGLYDMSGNVSEWCEDWFEVHSREYQIDPKGPTVGKSRICRGGGCKHRTETCIVTNRDGAVPTSHEIYRGFRLALVS